MWDWTWGGLSSGGILSNPLNPLGNGGTSLFSLTADSSYSAASNIQAAELQELHISILPQNTGTSDVSLPSFVNQSGISNLTHSDYDHTINRVLATATAQQLSINNHQFLYANGAFRTNWTASSSNNPYYDYSQWFNPTGELHDYSQIPGNSRGNYNFQIDISNTAMTFWYVPDQITNNIQDVNGKMNWLAVKYIIPKTSISTGQATYEIDIRDASGTPIPKSTNGANGNSPNGYWVFHYFRNSLFNGQTQTSTTGKGSYDQSASTTRGRPNYRFQKSTSSDLPMIIYIGIPASKPGNPNWG